jgi:ABC-2 type transport system ATP-binding protein
MSAEVIKTRALRKEYRIYKKEPGLLGSLRGLVKRQYHTVTAVKNIDLTIKAGELVGFIGPNGAGKTTTLKMLSGLLHPTSGEGQVLGFTPWQRPKQLLKQISLVMGQKAQLWWDLPLYDSLLLQRDIYEMTKDEFEKSLRELTELLDLHDFLKVQVRKLSLGQRMRGELAAAFIYKPKVMFLDEPTIGLDVVVQRKIRDFISHYNQRHQATIILTSHYLEDVRQLCKRVIVIDKGSVIFDGDTEKLITTYIDHKDIVITFEKFVPKEKLAAYGNVIEYSGIKATIQVARSATTGIASQLLSELPVEDIAIEEPSLEAVAQELFTGQNVA